jgi:CubicO group peptidase (beta-lactamase class C family)
VTIRQLLSHTSGYQDYWPQDYVMPIMLKPVTSQQILDTWARKALDFDPGTKWQYSNTNYVIAGLIIEKVSGMPMLRFLSERVFKPLGMNSVANVDENALGVTDSVGYVRYGLGPLRTAPKEAPGWFFSEEALKDFATGLEPLGALQDFSQTNKGLRGGMTLRVYGARFAQKNVRVWTYEMADGKLEQYQIAPQ